MSISMKPKFICALPDPVVNGQKCTSVAGICNHGNTAFIVKSLGSSSDNKYYPFAILKVSKFSSKPKVTTINVKNVKAKHANSITYARADGASKGSLFVTTSNPKTKTQVYKLSTSGKVEKELLYYGPDGQKSTISLISYYGMVDGRMMFITNGNAKDGRKRYNLTSFDGEKLMFYKALFTGENTDSDSYTNNDFTYQDGKLYHTFFKKSKGIVKYNRIYVYDVVGAANYEIRNASMIIKANATKDYDKCYEVEGVVLRDNKLYSANNLASSKADKNKDAVLRLAE